MDGMSCLQTINHLVEKEGTYGWNVFFVNNTLPEFFLGF
jgi:hypothetical protein